MALKRKLSSEVWAKLAKDLQGEYVEKEGSYILQLEGPDEDAEGYRVALGKERKAHEDTKAKLKAFGELDPEAAAEALRKVGEMSSWTPEQKVQEKIDGHTKQLSEKHRKELEGRDLAIRGLNGQLERVLITNVATAAITKAGGGRSLKALLPYVKSFTTLKKDEKGELFARVVDPESGVELVTKREGKHDAMTVEEFVESLKSDDAFSASFDAPPASGSGNEPGRRGGGSGSGGSKKVSARDQQALNKNIEGIANGTVAVTS